MSSEGPTKDHTIDKLLTQTQKERKSWNRRTKGSVSGSTANEERVYMSMDHYTRSRPSELPDFQVREAASAMHMMKRLNK